MRSTTQPAAPEGHPGIVRLVRGGGRLFVRRLQLRNDRSFYQISLCRVQPERHPYRIDAKCRCGVQERSLEPGESLGIRFSASVSGGGFALFRNREKRLEDVVLAALYLCLVAGYALNRFSSGSFMGERFYFEGFFAVSLLAGRRTAWYLALLAVSALVTLGLSLPAVFQAVQPYIEVRALAENMPLKNGVVFLKTSDLEFIAKHFNLNQADWRRAPTRAGSRAGKEAGVGRGSRAANMGSNSI